MTGKWILSEGYSFPKDCLVSLRLERARHTCCIQFFDTRKFGTLHYINAIDSYKPILKLGVDGLSLNDPEKQEIIYKKAARTKRPIKNLLLDQSVIAGAGNILACESLFSAGIAPDKPSCNVNMSLLCSHLHHIFLLGIDAGGCSISDYVDVYGKKGHFQSFLNVYGRQGEECFNCSNKIEKITQAGRSTFYCPVCQV